MVVPKSQKSSLIKKLLHTYKPFLINFITKTFLKKEKKKKKEKLKKEKRKRKRKIFNAKIGICLSNNT